MSYKNTPKISLSKLSLENYIIKNDDGDDVDVVKEIKQQILLTHICRNHPEFSIIEALEFSKNYSVSILRDKVICDKEGLYKINNIVLYKKQIPYISVKIDIATVDNNPHWMYQYLESVNFNMINS